MRYTTLIDITEDRAIYRSQSVRLVYLHLVLKSGYHDDDRDICRISLRSLAADAGITLSAVRHAIAKLVQAGMIEPQDTGGYKVKKWVPTVIPSSRKQVKMTQADVEAAREREERRIERERKADEERSTHEERIAYLKSAWEKNPHSMAGQAYQKILDEQNKKKQ